MTLALEQALAQGGIWALPVALAAGVLAGLNPCCLVLYPAVTATCCAAAAAERHTVVASRAAAFVFGTAAATSVLGVLAALAGHAVTLLGRGPRYALALVPIVMGLHLVGWIRLPLPSQGAAWRGEGLAAAFVAGLLLSLVVGSCGTPELAGILTYAAYKGSLVFGALLLFVYGVGNGLPLLLLGTSAGALTHRFGTGRAHTWAGRISGALLVGLGFYLLASV
jgi:cytochrome c biogenesis protein CcdA